MKQQAVIGSSRRRLAAILLSGVSAWCITKCLEWVGFYSAYADEPGKVSVLANAHLWAVSYACGSVLLGIGATVFIASGTRKTDDRLASTRYLLAAFAVTALVCICVVLVLLYSAAFHHRLGIAHP